MIWKCRVMQVKFIKVWCNKKIQSTRKPGSLVPKRERALVSTEWLFYNLAHPTPYPWYKEKLPALEDNFYQLTRNISDKKILKKVSVKILHALHADRLISRFQPTEKLWRKSWFFTTAVVAKISTKCPYIRFSHIIYITMLLPLYDKI